LLITAPGRAGLRTGERSRCTVFSVRSEGLIDFELVRTSDHLVDGAEAQLSHNFAKPFGDVIEEVDNLGGLTSKLGAM
jgi:hypothetical protein